MVKKHSGIRVQLTCVHAALMKQQQLFAGAGDGGQRERATCGTQIAGPRQQENFCARSAGCELQHCNPRRGLPLYPMESMSRCFETLICGSNMSGDTVGDKGG